MKKSNKSILDGIDLIKTKKICVTKRSVNVINELGTYKYADIKDQKEVKEVPLKIHDHTMDAIRYCIYTHYGRKRNFGVVT